MSDNELMSRIFLVALIEQNEKCVDFVFFSAIVLDRTMVVIHRYHPILIHLWQRINNKHPIHQHPLAIHSTTKTMLKMEIRHHLLTLILINHPHPLVIRHLIVIVVVWLFGRFMITKHKNKMNYHFDKVKFSFFQEFPLFIHRIL